MKWPALWKNALPLVAKADIAELVRLLRDMPYTSRGSKALWTKVIARLERSKDPVALATMEELATKGTTFYDKGEIEGLLAAAAKRMRAAGVRPKKPKKAAPTAVRDAVDADALVEKGDPRGEFALLQIARAEGRATKQTIAREKELLKEHEKTWLGGLAGLVRKGSAVWERGQLVGCMLDGKRGIVKRATGEPALATVTRLELHPEIRVEDEELVGFLTHPVLANLRAVIQLPAYSTADALWAARDRLPPLEEALSDFFGDRFMPLLHETLPHLRRLGDLTRWARGPDKELLESPLWPRLEEITVEAYQLDLGRWLDARTQALRELRIVPHVWANPAWRDGTELRFHFDERTLDGVGPQLDRSLFDLQTKKGIVKRLRVTGKVADEATLRERAKRLGAKLELR